MTGREWKPGDVAVTQFGRSVVDGGKRCGHSDARPHWHHTQGGWDPLDTHSDARPLAVIDPDDFGALLDIVQTMAIHQPGELIDTTTRKLQAALREFANPSPPKPDEPMGLYARVEDDKRRTWVRTAEQGSVWRREFRNTEGLRYLIPQDGCEDYANLDVVRVLNEGVQP